MANKKQVRLPLFTLEGRETTYLPVFTRKELAVDYCSKVGADPAIVREIVTKLEAKNVTETLNAHNGCASPVKVNPSLDGTEFRHEFAPDEFVAAVVAAIPNLRRDEAMAKALAAFNASLPEFKAGLVTFRFIGGPRDGEEMSSPGRPRGRGMTHAQSLWVMTRGGEVGRSFSGQTPEMERALRDGLSDGRHPSKGIPIPAGVSLHSFIYRVAGRVDDGDDAVVELVYAGVDSASVVDGGAKPPIQP